MHSTIPKKLVARVVGATVTISKVGSAYSAYWNDEIGFTYFAYFAYYFAYFAYSWQNTSISGKPAYCCIFFAYFIAYWIKLHILHIVHIKLHIIHIILHIILHILHIDFIYILCILCISNCILLAYFFAYSVAYLAYWQECIFYIFWHMLHIIFIFICI